MNKKTTSREKSGVTPGGRLYDARRSNTNGFVSKSTYLETPTDGYTNTEYSKETRGSGKTKSVQKTKSSGLIGRQYGFKEVTKGPKKALPGFGKKKPTAKKKK